MVNSSMTRMADIRHVLKEVMANLTNVTAQMVQLVDQDALHVARRGEWWQWLVILE